MTFPLLKQGCLELASLQRRETSGGRSWMRRARTRPGTAWASRVCSRNRPEPTGFEPAIFCVTGRHVRPLHHGSSFVSHRTLFSVHPLRKHNTRQAQFCQVPVFPPLLKKSVANNERVHSSDLHDWLKLDLIA